MEQALRRFFLRLELRRKSNRATQALTAFFLVAIALGTGLFALPAASADGRSCGFFTALFTATSTVCVTGLSLVENFRQWSPFGQAVLLLLIQIGGLGYMTFVSVFFFLLRRKIGLRERLILQQAMALNELGGVIQLLKLVLLGTLVMEGAGAVILTARFALEMPLGRAVWYGVFHAVSAYCNAGFDLLGPDSLMGYAGDIVVNLTVDALVILGGLGFFVWNDLLIHRFHWRHLAVYTRLVLITSGALLLGGWGAFLALEWGNPGTLGGAPVGEKLLLALFQSANTRSAGFYTLRQGALTGSGKLVSLVLMLIGGSSGSTTGGIKTVTVALLVIMAFQVMRNRRDVVVFGRKIPQDQINSAGAICFLVVGLALLGGVLLAVWDGLSLPDAIYESVAAIATVGLDPGVTAELSLGSKLLMMVYMFFGRVGIMTISLAFMTKTPPDNIIGHPETRVLLG